MKIQSLQTAGKILSSLDKRLTKFPDIVQSLIVFGVEHFLEHGDSGFLTRLVRTLEGHKGTVKGAKVSAYLKHHMPMLAWEALSDGTKGYKKVGTADAIPLTDRWDKFKLETTKQEKSDFDVMAEALERLEKRVEKTGSVMLAGLVGVMADYINYQVDLASEIAMLEEQGTPVSTAAAALGQALMVSDAA